MTIDVATAYRDGQDRQRALADQLMAVPRDANGALIPMGAGPVKPAPSAASLDTPGSAHQPAEWLGIEPAEGVDLDDPPAEAQPELDADPELPEQPKRMKVNPAQGGGGWEGPPARPTGIAAKVDQLLRTGGTVDLSDERRAI